jgi:Flp pilus assembly protein TadB
LVAHFRVRFQSVKDLKGLRQPNFLHLLRPRGLKPGDVAETDSARLKSCPDADSRGEKMPEEIQEIQEHAERAHEDPSLVPVTVTMATLAVLVAAVALLGHRAHTEELLNQTRATDTWAEYQAKSIREHGYEEFLDLLAVMGSKDAEGTEKTKQKYEKDVERYKQDREKLQEKATDLEKEVEHARHVANRFDLGEVCLEVALVITSMTLLTRRHFYWSAGIALAVLGLGIAATGFFVG